MVSPQTENGYTRIANEILDQLFKVKLNGTQFRIILVVWRYTYGFSRKQHELSEGFIAKAACINRKQISRELKELIDFNIIVVIKEATHTSSRIIAFNKNYDRWVLKSIQGTNKITDNQLEDRGGSELVDLTGSFLDPQDNKYLKQYINIDHLTEETGTNLFNTFWTAYPRKVAKTTAQKAFNKLKVDDGLLTSILIALEKQKQSKQWQDKQFIPHPATWLNQRRWEDETDETGESKETALIRTAAGTFKF